MGIEQEIEDFCFLEFNFHEKLVYEKFSAAALKDSSISFDAMVKNFNDLGAKIDQNFRYMFICLLGLCYIFFNKKFEVDFGPIKLLNLESILDLLLVATSFLVSVRGIYQFNLGYYSAIIQRMIKERNNPELWCLKVDETFNSDGFIMSEGQKKLYFTSPYKKNRHLHIDSPVLFLVLLTTAIYFISVFSGVYTIVLDSNRDNVSKFIVCLAVLSSHGYFFWSTKAEWTNKYYILDRALFDHLHSFLLTDGEDRTRERLNLLRKTIVNSRLDEQS